MTVLACRPDAESATVEPLGRPTQSLSWSSAGIAPVAAAAAAAAAAEHGYGSD